MDRQGLTRSLFALLAALLLSCAHRAPSPAPPADPGPPPPAAPPAAPREFRGVWVATVANIDWPSAPGLDSARQQAEAREIIGRARTLGLNAILFQVRPAADALYASNLEPWSESLSGIQGQPPEPAYDPLAFWIEEAHRAGLELHAWFNPYRARHSSAKSPIAPGHLATTRPELVRSYGEQLWLDPGEPAALEHSLAVVLDVVRRYDLDGVHIDDYFYPYPIRTGDGQKVDFPDERPWGAYVAAGGTMACADWRRSNVDRMVERLHREVHAAKPHLRVGVSPFGLGRPDRRPPGITGFSQYDEIYADVEHWLEQGWMDYLAPQLYWKRDAPGQPFAPLLAYWRGQNRQGRHVWPGLYTSRTAPPDPWPAEEITGQVELSRAGAADVGHIHFSAVALQRNHGGLRERLAAVYPQPALVPATPWLGGAPPPAPAVRLRRGPDPAQVRIERSGGEAPWLLAVWARYGGAWRFFVLPGGEGELPAQAGADPLGPVFASAVGRTGLEGPRVPVAEGGN